MATKRNSENPFSAIERPDRTAPPRLFYNYMTPNWSKENAHRCEVALCSRLIPHIQGCLRGTKHEGLFLHTTKCTIRAVGKETHSNSKHAQRVILLSWGDGIGRFLVETTGRSFKFELQLNSKNGAQEIFDLLRQGNQRINLSTKPTAKEKRSKKIVLDAEDEVLSNLYGELADLEKRKANILAEIETRKEQLKAQVADIKSRMRQLKKIIKAPTD